MSKILELFGVPVNNQEVNWNHIIEEQDCPFVSNSCYKIRKSQPEIAIGTCSVYYGKEGKLILICPNRLLERRQIFMDSIHLLTLHEPGNVLHVVPEVTIPGGSVDYFLVSAKGNKVQDFVGIELQTLDTTGTVWPERQRLLDSFGIAVNDEDKNSLKSFGMNWKMTAKTILVQLHHKIKTFEAINKHLVLVVQDHLLNYMRREFNFSHLSNARIGDPMHFHSYNAIYNNEIDLTISLAERLSTDTNGISICLGLQAEASLDIDKITALLESKISENTILSI